MKITITLEELEALKKACEIGTELAKESLKRTGTLEIRDNMESFIKYTRYDFFDEVEEPEFTYPMWFKDCNSNIVVRFDSLTSGEVVSDNCIFKKGQKLCSWTPHTDKTMWTQIEEPKEKWEPKPEFLEKACEMLKTEIAIRAYALEFDQGWEPDWDNIEQKKFYVFFDRCMGIYRYGGTTYTASLEFLYMRGPKGIMYMSESCAKGLVEKLNNGEVEF